MDEEWRPVVGWEHAYEVSSLGRVRSLDRDKEHFCRWGNRVRRIKGKVLTATIGAYGYPVAGLCDRPVRRVRQVHILVCAAFHGPSPEGCEVAHLNGIRTDNRATNLKWATPLENQGHRIGHGTDLRGEDLPQATMSEATAREILHRHRSGTRLRTLSAEYGIHKATIWNLVHRKTWAHIH